jgi:E3 SUMO-protein ligase RanBP2
MGFTKEQVEQHIAGVERRLGSEQERKMHGLRFAKMCYQAKMYEDAIRYLSGYLSVQERDPSAHKFMGRVCEAAEHPEKAIVHYRRSLALKKNQRDVIVSVAELYCKLENPPPEEVKDCLRLVESVMKGHPLVLSLNEKLHLLQGTLESSSMEDLITKQLAMSSQNTSLHIRLVQLYTSSGNLPNAFRYCQLMGEKGTFADNPAWQSCVMDTSEKYFQHLKASGCVDNVRLLEVLVMVMEGASALFVLLASGQEPSLAQCAALLLKFDKLVHAGVILLRPPCPPTPYRLVVRELCGWLYHMAAEYLFMSGSRRQCNVGVWQNEHLKMFGLGELCLLASLKATPPRMEGEWSTGAANKSLLKKWHTAACKRLCLVGRHLMLVAASKPEGYIKELPKEMGKEGGRLDLIRMLFSDNQVNLVCDNCNSLILKAAAVQPSMYSIM